ncbi:hypothetical protein D3C87_257400 [compost metagenome]
MAITCQTVWKGGLAFEAQMRGHKVMLDTKDADQGPTPKEILLASICACSGIDVASILQKMRVHLESCVISSETDTTTTYPSIFTEVKIIYDIKGSDIKVDQAVKAVTLSMTKYCGVSAMVVKAVPLKYEVILNGEKVAEAFANFEGVEA